MPGTNGCPRHCGTPCTTSPPRQSARPRDETRTTSSCGSGGPRTGSRSSTEPDRPRPMGCETVSRPWVGGRRHHGGAGGGEAALRVVVGEDSLLLPREGIVRPSWATGLHGRGAEARTTARSCAPSKRRHPTSSSSASGCRPPTARGPGRHPRGAGPRPDVGVRDPHVPDVEPAYALPVVEDHLGGVGSCERRC